MSDIFLEAGLISSGSLEGVVWGKHYERSLHCHKALLESLERLLMEQYVQHRNDNKILDKIRKSTQDKLASLVAAPGRDVMESVLLDKDFDEYLEGYLEYRNDVRDGKLGKTAQFWLTYMAHIHNVLSLIEAVMDNNFSLYAHILHHMSSYIGQNYACYLTY